MPNASKSGGEKPKTLKQLERDEARLVQKEDQLWHQMVECRQQLADLRGQLIEARQNAGTAKRAVKETAKETAAAAE